MLQSATCGAGRLSPSRLPPATSVLLSKHYAHAHFCRPVPGVKIRSFSTHMVYYAHFIHTNIHTCLFPQFGTGLLSVQKFFQCIKGPVYRIFFLVVIELVSYLILNWAIHLGVCYKYVCSYNSSSAGTF
jgi:hypothetical protein